MTRIGILGGTFDPIHLGHLIVASLAADELELDRVLFMPAQTPPHKRDALVTDARHRAQMVRNAIEPDPRFEFSDLDLQTDAPSYTSSLLRRYHAAHPHTELFFVIGADSLIDFPTWHEPERILDMAMLAVARRPGSTIDDSVLEAMPNLRERVCVFESPLIDISSTGIRERVRAGKNVSWLVPPSVEDYIRAHALYP